MRRRELDVIPNPGGRPPPGWRITAFIERTAEGAVRVADLSPKGFVRREHIGRSYADEGAAKLAISERSARGRRTPSCRSRSPS